jgi:hypothetical protein
MAKLDFKSELEALLLEEHSLARTIEVAAMVQGDADKFAIAWEIFCTSDPPLPQRMAWVISHVTDAHPALGARYATTIAARLPFFTHSAELRAAVRILSKTTIPKEAVGDLLYHLFPILEDPNVPVAIRVHAMQVLYQVSQLEPEIKRELYLVIENQMSNASPGYISRARKLLARLRREIQW